jgi:hypothetical protein
MMENVKRYIPMLCFLLVPFAFIAPGHLHNGHHLFFIISGLFLLAAMIRNHWVSAFLVYMGIWQIFILIYKLFIPHLPPSILADAMNVGLYFTVGAIIFLAISRSTLKTSTIFNVICISTIIQTLLAVLQHFWGDPIFLFLNWVFTAKHLLRSDAMTGTLGNNNFLAAYLAITAPLFFRRKWWMFLPAIAFVLIIAKTTSAVIPLAIGCGYYFFRRSLASYIIVAASIACAIFYAVFYHPFFHLSTGWYNDRLDMWMVAIKQVFATSFTAVFGLGPGAGWGQPYPMHSEWVQCLHQFGMVGLILLAGYVVTAYRGNRMLYACFLIAVINMAGNYPIHLAPSAFLIILIAGMMERERNEAHS